MQQEASAYATCTSIQAKTHFQTLDAVLSPALAYRLRRSEPVSSRLLWEWLPESTNKKLQAFSLRTHSFSKQCTDLCLGRVLFDLKMDARVSKH